MNHQDWVDLLPLYAAGRLEGKPRQDVENHLAGCQVCREELALWKAVEMEIVSKNLSIKLPSDQTVLQGAVLRSRRSPTHIGPFKHAFMLLKAQLPLVQRELWLASAAVFAIGFCGASLAGRTGLFQAIAPLVAVASVAAIYGPENDPALEMTMATPTSPRQVLLARLALVFGYDLVLALIASLGLLIITPVHLFGSLIIGWLGPMTFLSALALVLSTLIGARNAMTLALVAWFVDWGAYAILEGYFPRVIYPLTQSLAAAYTAFFASPAILFIGAGLLIVLALWRAGRQESSLPRMA